MEALPLAFSSGWASGVNAYLVVLVLGITDRAGDVAEIPDVLGRWDVLAVAGFLYAMEFVADKIPYVDSAWDVVSTAIRPTVGAVIGVLLGVFVLRRSNVARILLVISSAVVAVFSLLGITSGLSVVTLAAAVAVIVLLFVGGANDWFSGRGAAPSYGAPSYGGGRPPARLRPGTPARLRAAKLRGPHRDHAVRVAGSAGRNLRPCGLPRPP